VPGWVSHLEYFWQEPNYAAFLRRLASFSRLILFDKRGTGMSDRVPESELPNLEQRMDDVRAVMDAVGSEEAALLGMSEGGPDVPPLRGHLSGAHEGGNRAGLIRAADVGPRSPVGAERGGARSLHRGGRTELGQLGRFSRTGAKPDWGSGIEFEDRGVHELKGIPGEWRLYAVL
jgi:hypothetical protein